MTDEKYRESLYNIIGRIIKHEQILIIGSEVMRQEGSHSHIVDDFLLEQYRVHYSPDDSRYYAYPEIIRDNPSQFAASLLNPTLRTLLETGCFRIVLTTTFDPLLENALREIWHARGETLRVLNIWESGKQGDIDREETAPHFNPSTLQPTLYYLFGSAKEGPNNSNDIKKFILDDNDRIEVVTRWIKTPPAHLIKYIRSDRRRILALGCKLDDWLFRFFWFSLIGDTRKLMNSGEVAVTLDDSNDEQKRLHNYLERKIRLFVAPDSHKFLHELNVCLNDPVVNEERIKQMRREGGIFISYRSESFFDANRLFTRLSQSGYNVWLDHEQLEGGDKYREKIFHALDSSHVILMLIDVAMLDGFKQNIDAEHERFYYKEEWCRTHQLITCEEGKHLAIPIALHGCMRDERLKLLPEWIDETHMLDADTQYVALCKKIDEQLNP